MEGTPIKIDQPQRSEGCVNYPRSPIANATGTFDSAAYNDPLHGVRRLERRMGHTLTAVKQTLPMDDCADPLAPNPAYPAAVLGMTRTDLVGVTSRLEDDGEVPMDRYPADLGCVPLQLTRETNALCCLIGKTAPHPDRAMEQGAEKILGASTTLDWVPEGGGEGHAQSEVRHTLQGGSPHYGREPDCRLRGNHDKNDRGGEDNTNEHCEGCDKASPLRTTGHGAEKSLGLDMTLDYTPLCAPQRVPPVMGRNLPTNSLRTTMRKNGGENIINKIHEGCSKEARSRVGEDGNSDKDCTSTQVMEDELKKGTRGIYPRACKKGNQLPGDISKPKTTRSPHDSKTKGKRKTGDPRSAVRNQKELRTVSEAGVTRTGPVTRSMRRNQTQHL